MDVIPSNQWPQIDEKSCMLMASTMEKSSRQQQQQQQQPLKCPRCDSSNTKFCYYNNYSLSQPRHFCKACKRYWTRGGTLRNVPVGGGCRKNKRNSGLKRPISSVNEPSTHHLPPPLPAPPNPKPHSGTQINVSSSSSSDRVINPIFYGVPSDHHSLNLPVLPGRFMNSRVSDGFDMNLGFNGFNNQEIVASNSLLSSYNSMFGNSNLSSTTTSPTLATLLASTFQQQKFNNNLKDANTNHQIQDQLASFQDLQMVKDQAVKLEHGESGFDWCNNMQSHIDHINHHQFAADPSIYSNNWNPNSSVSVGTWHDPSSNIGSSVPSLI